MLRESNYTKKIINLKYEQNVVFSQVDGRKRLMLIRYLLLRLLGAKLAEIPAITALKSDDFVVLHTGHLARKSSGSEGSSRTFKVISRAHATTLEKLLSMAQNLQVHK